MGVGGRGRVSVPGARNIRENLTLDVSAESQILRENSIFALFLFVRDAKVSGKRSETFSLCGFRFPDYVQTLIKSDRFRVARQFGCCYTLL